MVSVQDVARFCFAVMPLAALAALAWRGMWRRLPVWFCCLCCMAVIGASYAPESRRWIAEVYMRVEPLATLLRLGAAVEIACVLTVPEHRRRLVLGLALVSIAAALLVWRIEPGSDVFAFVQLRRYIQIATAVWMLALLGVFWAADSWRWDRYGAHACILTALTIKQAMYSMVSFRGFSAREWFAADWPGLLVTSLCCLCWLLIGLRASRTSALPA